MDVLEEKLAEIAEWLKTVKFKRTTFGGVSEADVWKKISELNSLYEKALIAVQTEQRGGEFEEDL